jgi:diguanylate cyclase (GGDEF)-like protein
LPLNPPGLDRGAKAVGQRHIRLSVVVPIGVIVAVAIVCVIVAVLGSTRRADEVALDHERELFIRSLTNNAERVLRETESIVTSEPAAHRIGAVFNPEWVETYVGQRLQSFFAHNLVFVTDANDRLLYASPGSRNLDPNWFNSIIPNLQPMLDELRGRAPRSPASGAAIELSSAVAAHRALRLQAFLAQPAIVAAVAVAPSADSVQPSGQTVVSVKFIDHDMLAEIASRLQLRNLRVLNDQPAPAGDYVFDLKDPQGTLIARFSWTPKQPGAEIMKSVLPFIAVALAGFALLAGLVLHNMRRTAMTIASGESRLRYLALHDPLCGLPNRIYFGERLEEMIEKVRMGGQPAAVLYIDLDHFKDVNDTLGHPIGDDLIRNVTRRITHSLRNDDVVARLGGDEFAVITADVDLASLQTLATRMIATLCAPYSIGNHTIVIGASIGIAIIHEHVSGAADVMRHADMALYRAKNEGRNRACIYDEAMDANLLRRKLLENELRLAIENDELKLAYQPIVNSSGETILGVEALCRWTHPQRGEIPPIEFIPVAENSGLIVPLGELVLRRACLDAKAWPGIFLAVNVSPLQFRRTDFVDVVERILAETGLDPSRLEIEVTESTLIGNVDSAELAMFRLKALGVRLALDDFGTGYSSLQYLRRFPFDKLKIDSSFVRSIERAADAAAIVHAVVSLGRGLGMKVTAEGVETAEQHLFLRAAGVHSLQGYRFGRPCPAADITALLLAPHSINIADDVVDLAKAG